MAFPVLERILSLFTNANDPEVEKRRLLKEIGKALSKNKFRFFKLHGEEVQPGFGKFFYDIYKIVAPAQVFLQNASSSAQLKSIVIDSFLDEKMVSLQESFSEESINERAKTTPTKELARQVKDSLVNYYAGFDSNRVRAIDQCYSSIIAFCQFINFDYFFLLKKFDSNITERSFVYHAKFEPIKCEYVSEDVKDFLEVLLALDLEQDWKAILGVLKLYKGVEVVPFDQWNKLLNALREIKRSEVLTLMARYIDKNPRWESKVRTCDERIVEPYLQKLKTQSEVMIQKILQEKRNAKIDELAMAIFGTTAVSRMKNYTERANVTFSKKMLGGFTQVQGLNYLKAFLLDYFKKDIRELVDLFLIRGQWSTNLLSQQLSEGFHGLMDVSEKLLAFDESMGDDGEQGVRLRGALAKAERDKEQLKYLRTLLKGINDEAQLMLNTAAQDLILIGKNLKSLLDDYKEQQRERIINWKEIEMASEQPISERITNVYKKIYYFVQLMQYFAKQDTPPDGE